MPSFLSRLFGRAPDPPNKPAAGQLDYEKAHPLDAENLAELGIAEAYQSLLPALRAFVAEPAAVEEIVDEDLPSYAIRCSGAEHLVFSAVEPGTERESWGRATYVFFRIVNEQLAGTPVRFYALNGGNDLCGMFLTPEEALESRNQLPRASDWPYLPEVGGPDYGQFR